MKLRWSLLGVVAAVFCGLLTAQDAKPKLPTFEAKEFKGRREAFAKEVGSGWIVASARKPVQGFKEIWPTEGSVGYGLSFFYLVGRDLANARVVIEAPGGRTILFADGDAKKLQKDFVVDEVRAAGAFAEFMKEMAKKSREVAIDAMGVTAEEMQTEGLEPSSRTFSAAMVRLREVKSEPEKEMLRKAADLTNRAHVAAIKAGRAGINEGEIQKIIEKTMRDQAAEGLAFGSICASSSNTPVIHYRNNNKEVKDGELMLCDVGGSYLGYATDITRTWPVNGRFSELQRKEYEAVLASQKAAEKILKPGVSWRELDAAAAKEIVDRGFAKVSYKNFHGLGHYVGLQTHDVGNYRGALKEGMCITIEPGIYDRENMISIRIEDTYLVTKDGFERLSAGAPREVDEIESMMKRASKEY
ncbi:MAG TPA: M24 family metallopeptidase [Planctomycetota bacterium]|nr:M24 family metallopeptidase [Planctomycetota bacterium]